MLDKARVVCRNGGRSRELGDQSGITAKITLEEERTLDSRRKSTDDEISGKARKWRGTSPKPEVIEEDTILS